MWLWLSLTALLCWSGSDLFSKIGCRDGSDRYSHLKMVIAVGVVMGLHAAFEIFVGGTAITIFKWLYLSAASRQPILENRSDPLQQRRAIRESQNHIF